MTTKRHFKINWPLTSTYTYSFNSKAEFEEYLCPVCFELPIAPKEIYQCSQGHFLCNVCLKKIDKKCPTCRENWENVPNLPARNRMAENLLQKMTENSKSEPIESKRKNESGAMNTISQKKAKSSNSTADATSIAVSDSQNTYTFTGKSLSEALIFASTNPQYDHRLFIELKVQYMEIARLEHVVNPNWFLFWHSEQFMYTTCSELAISMYWTCNSM